MATETPSFWAAYAASRPARCAVRYSSRCQVSSPTRRAAINVAVENLGGELAPADRLTQASAARAEVQRLTRLVQDLLDMARVFRLSRGKTLWNVVLPQITPYIFSSSRYGIGIAWKIAVVVELMGGIDPAFACVESALRAGRPVVTANKLLLATHGAQLEATARTAGAALRFESAVAAGVPVISVLAKDLAANEVSLIRGIVNGTTNYILTKMESEGWTYDRALGEAQKIGYAEADPRSDVEGEDAAAKLVVLARMAAGTWPSLAHVALDAAPGIASHAWLFGEDQGRYVVTAPTAAVDAIEAKARAAGVEIARIGTTGGDALTVAGEAPIPLVELLRAHEDWLPSYMSSSAAQGRESP